MRGSDSTSKATKEQYWTCIFILGAATICQLQQNPGWGHVCHPAASRNEGFRQGAGKASQAIRAHPVWAHSPVFGNDVGRESVRASRKEAQVGGSAANSKKNKEQNV